MKYLIKYKISCYKSLGGGEHDYWKLKGLVWLDATKYLKENENTPSKELIINKLKEYVFYKNRVEMREIQKVKYKLIETI